MVSPQLSLLNVFTVIFQAFFFPEDCKAPFAATPETPGLIHVLLGTGEVCIKHHVH